MSQLLVLAPGIPVHYAVVSGPQVMATPKGRAIWAAMMLKDCLPEFTVSIRVTMILMGMRQSKLWLDKYRKECSGKFRPWNKKPLKHVTILDVECVCTIDD